VITIVPYDPAWPGEFAALRAELADILGPWVLRIDHIGSTSVPGLGAKDVIDVQVTVAELATAIRDALVAAGFQHFPEHSHDHVPAGEDPTPERWAKLTFNQGAGRRRANVHVRVAGRPNQRYALLFRDYLRAHPASRATIERIKRELARHHGDDVEAYYDIKDPVYDLVWDAAQDWAARSEWRPA